MKFQDLLLHAKVGNQDAIHTILEMYQPLLFKESIVLGAFDEDLYQELCIIFLKCIQFFRM